MKYRYITLIKEDHTGIIDENLYVPVVNMHELNKPRFGIFGSLYEEDIISEWYQFSTECTSIQYNRAIMYNIKEDSKVYIIDSKKDLEDLFRIYTLTATSYSYSIDFEKMSKYYDALIITYDGFYKNRDLFNGGFLCLNGERNLLNLYSWDCNTILLFNTNCIAEYKTVELSELEKSINQEEN